MNHIDLIIWICKRHIDDEYGLILDGQDGGKGGNSGYNSEV